MRLIQILCLFTLAACSSVASSSTAQMAAAAPSEPGCSSCAEWNVAHPPVQIFGNTYYVGTNGLSAILVTSPEGHVLIDGALPESAPRIMENIAALGFQVRDVRLILARLESGRPGVDDPQYGLLRSFPSVPEVQVIADGERLRVGPLALTAHFTPGHTPGGTSWSWQSCDESRCLDLVYADSLTPISADGFLFSRSTRYPSVLSDYARSYAVLERLSCDILLTPHPSASNLWQRVSARDAGAPDALIDRTACTAYAAAARERLAQRVTSEK